MFCFAVFSYEKCFIRAVGNAYRYILFGAEIAFVYYVVIFIPDKCSAGTGDDAGPAAHTSVLVNGYYTGSRVFTHCTGKAGIYAPWLIAVPALE